MFEITRYYPHKSLAVWSEVVNLHESLWYTEPVGYRPMTGSRFIMNYPGLPGTRFTGTFECEVTAFVPGGKFCMYWVPRVSFGTSPRYELSFTFQPRAAGVCLTFALAGLDISDRTERAVRHMFGRGMERALTALGTHLDHLAPAHMDHAS